MINEIYQGDSFELIKSIDNNSIDLIMTSPIYADVRNYGKDVNVIHPDNYVEYILPIFYEFNRILKDSGSVIFNLGTKVHKRKRHIYPFELITKIERNDIINFYDFYIWHKKSGIPNGGNKRFDNKIEFIFHFCKNPQKIKINIDKVREKHNENTIKRLAKYHVNTGYGVDENGKQIQILKHCKLNPKGKIPDNVFRFNTNQITKGNIHPAAFHENLPSYFIKFLTEENDLVFDPFSGSGTTCLAAKKMKRNYIGFDLNQTYVDFSKERLKNVGISSIGGLLFE